jgi:hypothetical protein
MASRLARRPAPDRSRADGVPVDESHFSARNFRFRIFRQPARRQNRNGHPPGANGAAYWPRVSPQRHRWRRTPDGCVETQSKCRDLHGPAPFKTGRKPPLASKHRASSLRIDTRFRNGAGESIPVPAYNQRCRQSVKRQNQGASLLDGTKSGNHNYAWTASEGNSHENLNRPNWHTP